MNSSDVIEEVEARINHLGMTEEAAFLDVALDLDVHPEIVRDIWENSSIWRPLWSTPWENSI